MSDPISLMAGIVFFGAVYYRAEYIRFLGPIWLAIFITERGLLFTGLGFVTATVCVVVALLVIYNSFFTKSGKKSNEATNGNMVEGVSRAGSNNNKAKYANHRFEGKLVYHGLENWKHDPNNDKSYLVTIRSGGKDHEIWAVGLKNAVETCGAQVGDIVSVWKESEVRTDKAQVFDESGKVTGYRTLLNEKRRGIWVMQVLAES
ncbi:TPA: nickase [Citrobacter freundii]|nr:nickase [Citrobacter freundii]